MDPTVLGRMSKHYVIVSIKCEIGIENCRKQRHEQRNHPRRRTWRGYRKRNLCVKLSIITWSKKKVTMIIIVQIGKRKCPQRDHPQIFCAGYGHAIRVAAPVLPKATPCHPIPMISVMTVLLRITALL